MTVIDEDEAAQKIRDLATDSNSMWAQEIAEAENERRCVNEAPAVLVALERAVDLVAMAAGGDDILHAVVSLPLDGPGGNSLLVLTPTLVIQAPLAGHFDDDPLVTVLPRSGIRSVSMSSHFEDNNPRDPDSGSTSTSLVATYEGGGQALYEDGLWARFPMRTLLEEFRRDLAR